MFPGPRLWPQTARSRVLTNCEPSTRAKLVSRLLTRSSPIAVLANAPEPPGLSDLLTGYPSVRNYDGSWTEWGNLVGAPISAVCNTSPMLHCMPSARRCGWHACPWLCPARAYLSWRPIWPA